MKRCLDEIVRRVVRDVMDESYSDTESAKPKRRNVVTIRITSMPESLATSRNKELFMSTYMMLRKARNVGDIENINHTQLGKLKQFKGTDPLGSPFSPSTGVFDFEIL